MRRLMKNKKIWIAALAAVLTMGAVTGCARNKKNTKKADRMGFR